MSDFKVLPLDEGLLDTVASRLELRRPNKEAIEVLSLSMSRWYEKDRGTFFEGVIDAATGVGKTFIIAGTIDYFAAQGVRNFAIIVPGQTILNKTVAQFTQGPKSLLPLMATVPKVITSENFTTSDVAVAIEDDEQVKLYVFTVQALTKPDNSQVGKRTHKFQEGLGGAFYQHLDDMEDLLVFADEHHCYFGPSFSRAVRDLTPLALVGLTGTPHQKTKEEEIIFRYPLTAAIADEFVKTPVLVGRKDDRTDEQTQLLDGVALLETKEKALHNYCEAAEIDFVHPIMLVNCRDIDHAQETVAYLTAESFQKGKYGKEGVVLEVHSNQSDKALEALDKVEESGNPCRIIVQVGMLKEGWDVKNVYVIASLRASVSDILTEQTMGRGLRLPFGSYVEDMPLLNELDVLAHERYEDLLKRTGALKESFIDKRTILVRFTNEDGKQDINTTTETVSLDVSEGVTGEVKPGSLIVGSVEDRLKSSKQAAAVKRMEMSEGAPDIQVPTVKTLIIPQTFSLAQINAESAFRELGHRLATHPEDYLKRTKLGGEINEDEDGERTVEVTTDEAVHRVKAAQVTTDEEAAKAAVIEAVMSDRSITKRKGERTHVANLLDVVLGGSGDKAGVVLSSYPRALVAGMTREIRKARRQLPSAHQTATSVELHDFKPVRFEKKPTSGDRKGGKFDKSVAYTGWKKGLFEQASFDSSPERDMANILDEDDEIIIWVRLHQGDLPILWDEGREYHPDLLAITKKGEHCVIETKADKDLATDEVQGKRQAALTWAKTVSAETGTNWVYLLVAERDLQDAQGSWKRLRQATAA
jgi:type III restriction enzyme